MELLLQALAELPAPLGLQVLVVLIIAAIMRITKVAANVVRTSNKEVRLNKEVTAAPALVSNKLTAVPVALLLAVTTVTATPLAAQVGVKVLAPVLPALQEAQVPVDLQAPQEAVAVAAAVLPLVLVDHLAALVAAQEEDDSKN